MITIHDVVKAFGNQCVLDHISLEVHRGEVFGFLGPNGAGKTTTIKLLTTLTQPTSGTLEIDGFDPVRQGFEVRRRFGIVFQDPTVDNEMTAWENMNMHAELFRVSAGRKRQRIGESLELVGLTDHEHEFVRTFSGGMKRRLELARALLHKPKILFMDEPTLGLDPQARIAIWNHIELMRRESKLTVFFTTHYMDEAEQHADRVAIIDHGRIIAQGSPSDLKQETQSSTLEDAFVALTGPGTDIPNGAADHMRLVQAVWRHQ